MGPHPWRPQCRSAAGRGATPGGAGARFASHRRRLGAGAKQKAERGAAGKRAETCRLAAQNMLHVVFAHELHTMVTGGLPTRRRG